MGALSLSVALSDNPMTAPIHSGRVAAEGIDWSVSAIHPSEMFWRQLKFGEFDISEMSLSSMTIAASQGVRDWVAIPVFTTRRFFHTAVVVRTAAGIESPADLVGKRVGVPEYQQTAAVWTRGALLHEFGVAPEQLTWFMERPPELSHGGATAFAPPTGVQLSYIPGDTNVGEMLRVGQLDAAVVYIAHRNLVDRSRSEAGAIGGVRTLFADPRAEGIRYYAKTGLLPVNHVVVVRASLLEKHPWVALNVYSAMLEAKRVANEPVLQALQPWEQLGLLPPETAADIRAADPLPYGIQAQGVVLETLAEYLVEQGLAKRLVDIKDLFAPSTLSL
ncbi:ABC transporter substrate-binding protein [Rugosimonospora acidiphila]|uniref:ABC transporter substrate-binding protein n=1 Tax=Rugosimonospora acidiphila TaxID=556531 RepID=A0ABP9SRW2_9ACTN